MEHPYPCRLGQESPALQPGNLPQSSILEDHTNTAATSLLKLSTQGASPPSQQLVLSPLRSRTMASEEHQRDPAVGGGRPQVSAQTEGGGQPSAQPQQTGQQQNGQPQQHVQRDPPAPEPFPGGRQPGLAALAASAFYPPLNAEQLETLETGFGPLYNSLEDTPLREFGSSLPPLSFFSEIEQLAATITSDLPDDDDVPELEDPVEPEGAWEEKNVDMSQNHRRFVPNFGRTESSSSSDAQSEDPSYQPSDQETSEIEYCGRQPRYDSNHSEVGSDNDILHPWSSTHIINDSQDYPCFWDDVPRDEQRLIGDVVQRRVPTQGSEKHAGKVDRKLIAVQCNFFVMGDREAAHRCVRYIRTADRLEAEFRRRREEREPAPAPKRPKGGIFTMLNSLDNRMANFEQHLPALQKIAPAAPAQPSPSSAQGQPQQAAP
ncbi:hypothetical protein KFL_005250050, partial [Klebsormidium nitens]